MRLEIRFLLAKLRVNLTAGVIGCGLSGAHVEFCFGLVDTLDLGRDLSLLFFKECFGCLTGRLDYAQFAVLRLLQA